jgi:hypothetical protein
MWCGRKSLNYEVSLEILEVEIDLKLIVGMGLKFYFVIVVFKKYLRHKQEVETYKNIF